MSGFTRDDDGRLIYEVLDTKWNRYHGRHCGCDKTWLDHAEAAGFEIINRHGYISLAGAGLTEGVDENFLTTNVLWEAVTGKPGVQDWPERIR